MTDRPIFLDRNEAAEYLGVSRSWLADRAKRTDGPDLIRIGGKVRYLKEALDEYIRQSTVQSGSALATNDAPTIETKAEQRKARADAKKRQAKAEVPVTLSPEDLELALRLKKAGKLK